MGASEDSRHGRLAGAMELHLLPLRQAGLARHARAHERVSEEVRGRVHRGGDHGPQARQRHHRGAQGHVRQTALSAKCEVKNVE